MAPTLRFWLWASCHGAVLSFLVLTTSALMERSIVPVTLLYCVVSGFMTGLWTGRADLARIVGGTAALISEIVLFLTIGATHWGSLNMPWFAIAAVPIAVVTLAVLGFVGGAVGGVIAAPLEAGRAIGRVAADGPAWRCVQALRRVGSRRRP